MPDTPKGGTHHSYTPKLSVAPLPSFPSWIIDGTKPQRLSWLLKSQALPWIYWNAMLKGREWMADPRRTAA